MSKGDSITSAAYNNLQATTSLVLGANPTGYGQFLNSAPAQPNTVVSSTQWNSVRTDMIRAYIHQTNNTPAVEDVLAIVNVNPPYLQTIGSSTVISDAILTQYTNFSNFINTNKNQHNAAQLTPNVAITSTQRTANWGGATDVISHTVTLTFNGYTQNGGAFTVTPADHATYFFNTGGYIQISGTFVPTIDPPAAGTKNAMWKDLLNQFQQIYFGANNTQSLGGGNTNTATSTEGGTGPTADSTLPGTATTTGFFQLVTGSTNYTQIFRTTGPTTPNNKYVENDYIIKVRRPTASTLEFVITFRDDDAGDQTGIGSAVDEEVTGTLTSLVRCTRPSGTGGNVDVPAPTGVATAL
jgi:hypothetical protein